MEVEIDTAQYKSEHTGQTYYFCSVGCQQAFEEDPHQYLPDDHHRKGYTHD
jgi:Cu+-exporting ATPase